MHEASDIIVVADTSGRLTYVSPAFDRILGASATDFRIPVGSRADASRGSGSHASPGRWRFDEAADQGMRAELRLRHADGTWRWFEVKVTNHLENPKVLGIVGNLHDITERKQAEDALQEAHERFRSAFENAPIGMAMTDLKGHILRANSAYGRIVGRTASELCGMSVHDVTQVADRESSKAEMARLVSSDSDGYRIENRCLHADGHDVWVSVSVSCVRDHDGNPLYLIGQIEDVTERRALRERLAYAAIHDPLTTLPNRGPVHGSLGGCPQSELLGSDVDRP